MRDIVYYFVFEGLPDWEAALALAEIHKSERYEVRTVALSTQPVAEQHPAHRDRVVSELDAPLDSPLPSLWARARRLLYRGWTRCSARGLRRCGEQRPSRGRAGDP